MSYRRFKFFKKRNDWVREFENLVIKWYQIKRELSAKCLKGKKSNFQLNHFYIEKQW